MGGLHPAYMVFNADYGRAIPRDSDSGKMMQRLERAKVARALVVERSRAGD